MRNKRVGSAKRAHVLDSQAEFDNDDWCESPVLIEPDEITHLKGIETDREYEGLLALRETTGRRNATPESDKATAQELCRKYSALQEGANAGLHKFLAFIYDVYVPGRVFDTCDGTLSEWRSSKMKGVNRKTHPIARLIKVVLGEEGQKNEHRQSVHQWSCCLRRLVEDRVPVGSAADYIAKNGGVVQIAKKFSADQRAAKNVKSSPHPTHSPASVSPWSDTFIRLSAKRRLEEIIKAGGNGKVKLQVKISGSGKITIVGIDGDQVDD